MIVSTENTCGGHPRIDSTRIEVFTILQCLSEGITLNEIAEDYNISVEQVKESITWTKDFLIKHFEEH